MENKKIMQEEIMVTVLCTAYNHEEFIASAIEGVMNQKTNFKFELIVHDDASEDRTAEIIREYKERYPDSIFPIVQKENQYRCCNIYRSFLFPNVRGKYIAFCEGDDYWTDQDKLQMQVDFLESHEDYSMCMHNAVKRDYGTGEESCLDTFPGDGTYSQKQHILAGLGTGFPAFASYMVRANLLGGMPEFFLSSKVLNYPLRQYYANCGKVYYFGKPMSVYRAFTPQSYMKVIMGSQQLYNQYTLEMIHFFEEFNKYTKGEFNEVLECKIISDYFGFCQSIPEEKGIPKAMEAGLDIDKVAGCYKRLSETYLDSSILRMFEEGKKIFIYGTSRIAQTCKRQLDYAGITFVGFVVSDGQKKAEAVDGKEVHYLGEVIANYHNPGFILAVQPVNVGAVAAALKQYNVKEFCIPYGIEG